MSNQNNSKPGQRKPGNNFAKKDKKAPAPPIEAKKDVMSNRNNPKPGPRKPGNNFTKKAPAPPTEAKKDIMFSQNNSKPGPRKPGNNYTKVNRNNPKPGNNFVKKDKKAPAPPTEVKQVERPPRPPKIFDPELHEFCRSLRSILNKVCWGTYNKYYAEFANIMRGKPERYMKIAAGMVAEKAAMDPVCCAIYAKMCKQRVGNRRPRHDKFLASLVQQSHLIFKDQSKQFNKIKKVTHWMNRAPTEDARVDLEERIGYLKQKVQVQKTENVNFFAQMYIADMIKAKHVSLQINWWHRRILYMGGFNEEYLIQAIRLLKLVGKVYAEDESSHKRHEDVVKFIMFATSNLCKRSLSTHGKCVILDFEEFVLNHFVPIERPDIVIFWINFDKPQSEEERKNAVVAKSVPVKNAFNKGYVVKNVIIKGVVEKPVNEEENKKKDHTKQSAGELSSEDPVDAEPKKPEPKISLKDLMKAEQNVFKPPSSGSSFFCRKNVPSDDKPAN